MRAHAFLSSHGANRRRMAIVRAELRKNVRVVIMALCARIFRTEVFRIGKVFLLGGSAAELFIDWLGRIRCVADITINYLARALFGECNSQIAKESLVSRNLKERLALHSFPLTYV